MTKETLMEFPCEFPIKVMGEDSAEFRLIARQIVETHTGTLESSRVTERHSTQGRYLALTFTVSANNQQQLDSIYRALTACELVKMAL
jgi:putative lipoic acid-binding regulatory protein